jgi:hypothetical protein
MTTRPIEQIRDCLSRLTRAAFGETVAFASIPARPGHDADLVLSDAVDELEQLRASLKEMEVDAQRWRKLMTIGRVRSMGSAGKPGEYHHLGLELWSQHPANDSENGRATLTAYVDALSPAAGVDCSPGPHPARPLITAEGRKMLSEYVAETKPQPDVPGSADEKGFSYATLKYDVNLKPVLVTCPTACCHGVADPMKPHRQDVYRKGPPSPELPATVDREALIKFLVEEYDADEILAEAIRQFRTSP